MRFLHTHPTVVVWCIMLTIFVVAVALVSCQHQPPGEDLWLMVK